MSSGHPDGIVCEPKTCRICDDRIVDAYLRATPSDDTARELLNDGGQPRVPGREPVPVDLDWLREVREYLMLCAGIAPPQAATPPVERQEAAPAPEDYDTAPAIERINKDLADAEAGKHMDPWPVSLDRELRAAYAAGKGTVPQPPPPSESDGDG